MLLYHIYLLRKYTGFDLMQMMLRKTLYPDSTNTSLIDNYLLLSVLNEENSRKS